jgi:hypothetical protein
VANVKDKAREERLKSALRENLKRRKAQARSRRPAEGDGASSHDGPRTSKERAE